MTIQEFIEKAIRGGWRPELIEDHHSLCSCGGEDLQCVARGNKWALSENLADLVLQPLAWQAVGKVEGWEEDLPSGKPSQMGWLMHMHRMIDALAEGKDIESFLSTL